MRERKKIKVEKREGMSEDSDGSWDWPDVRVGWEVGAGKRGRGCLCSFETHLCAGPVLFTALQLSSARVLFRVQAFQWVLKEPLSPLNYHFHTLCLLSSLSLPPLHQTQEQRQGTETGAGRMAPITNINLKRCWRVASTFIHKYNLGFFCFSVPCGGLFGGSNELGFQAKGEAEDLQHNYPRIEDWRCDTLLKQRHMHAQCLVNMLPTSGLIYLQEFFFFLVCLLVYFWQSNKLKNTITTK